MPETKPGAVRPGLCALRTMQRLRGQGKCGTIKPEINDRGEWFAMQPEIRAYRQADAAQAAAIWNEVVRAGDAFPQTELLDEQSGHAFFFAQSFTGVACDPQTGVLAGLYILHPNNVGRCGHICNASYAVRGSLRGQHIGEALVRHCMAQAKMLGFRILQFNAVVAANHAALALYKKLGFVQLGTIPGGFRLEDGSYVDIIPHYIAL